MRALLLLLASVAFAQTEGEAEHTRLQEEMIRREAHTQWAGVERAYQRMLQLDPGLLTYEDHWRAAQAAESMGHPTDAWACVQRAIALDPTDEALAWKAMIMANYGQVDLQIGRKGETTIQVAEMPFDPKLRNAIEAARTRLARDRCFVGLLPLGRYSLGDQPFEVVGGPVIVLKTK